MINRETLKNMLARYICDLSHPADARARAAQWLSRLEAEDWAGPGFTVRNDESADG